MTELVGAAQCVVCAWRENCKKKYSVQESLTHRCPDFERDRTIKPEPEGSPAAKESK